MPGGKVRSHVYETPRQADMAAAVDCLHAHGYERAAVVGVCSGAHHALRLSARDPRIAEVFAISPVKLVWRKGDSLVFGKADLGRATSSYLDSLAERRTWRRLVRGQLDVTGISRMFGGRVRARALGAIDRLSGRSPLKDMRALAARGGRALLLMGLGDVSLDEVETYFGPKGARLKRLPRMTVRVVPQLDHGLALRESRRIALDMLVDWMVEGG
jgi:pimeloyl-ACP methyl ester carboxylesterase